MGSIIPIFIPHVGCPHDCVFCNQKKIAGTLIPPTGDDVSRTIASSLERAKLPCEVAFYGGSFTAVGDTLLNEYLGAVSPFIEGGDVLNIRISTRPDCISDDILNTLSRYGVRTIELGAQSMDDSVLRASGRGHTAEHVRKASTLIKSHGFNLVLQMMTHLPCSDDEKDINTARELASLLPNAVRVYPTVVVRDTALEVLWREGKYVPASPEEAATLGAKIIDIFEAANIPIIRFGLNPTEDLSDGDALAGAYHPALGEMAQAARYLASAEKEIESKGISGGEITLFVSPKRISAMSGIQKQNKLFLCEKYGFSKISVKGDASLKSGEVRLEK
ncbi:MAG: radical SAM protein [Oscillospiraceae bacterium]|nr:radical SAM protein [Oscillospiraceae bacterium]